MHSGRLTRPHLQTSRCRVISTSLFGITQHTPRNSHQELCSARHQLCLPILPSVFFLFFSGTRTQNVPGMKTTTNAPSTPPPKSIDIFPVPCPCPALPASDTIITAVGDQLPHPVVWQLLEARVHYWGWRAHLPEDARELVTFAGSRKQRPACRHLGKNAAASRRQRAGVWAGASGGDFYILPRPLYRYLAYFDRPFRLRRGVKGGIRVSPT